MLARIASWKNVCSMALAVLCLAVSASHAETPTAVDVTGGIVLEEVRAELPWSGRVNTVAVDPAEPNHVLAATETGGLFGSVDGGISWAHVDAIPTMRLIDVAFWPANTEVVIATAQADWNNVEVSSAGRRITTSRGGIWISRDRGVTWEQTVAANPAALASGVTCPERYSAYGIAVDPRSATIAVATDCGVSVSSDGGDNWSHVQVSPWPTVWTSVAAFSEKRLVVAGKAGIWWTDNGGTSWQPSDWPDGATNSPHSLVTMPFEPLGAIAALNDGLLRTKDGGKTWSPFSGPEEKSAPCGGQLLVEASATMTVQKENRRRGVEIYYGDGCSLFEMSASEATPGEPIQGRWFRITQTLPGARAIGFETKAIFDDEESGFHRTNELRFLASHGGLERFETNGETIKSVGPVGSGPTGLTALQVSDVAGQRVRGAGEYQLVLGSQGTNLISTLDGFARYATTAGQGIGLDLLRVVPARAQAMMTYRVCDPCRNQASTALFNGARAWADPPGADFWPRLLRDGRAVQLRNAPPSSHEPRRLFIREANNQWRSVAEFSEAVAGDIGMGGPLNNPTLYVPVRGEAPARDLVGLPPTFNVWHLARISSLSGEKAEIDYPAMRYADNSGLRHDTMSLGFMPTSTAWLAVYGVDPGDPMHLLAPDVLAGVMAESWDGGETWTPRLDLTAMITRGGATPFVTRGTENGASVYFPLVSAVSFHPDEPSLVLVGTLQAGVFFSRDRGASWMRVPDSERATMVSDVHWKSLNEAYVATYGRGLWRLRMEPVLSAQSIAAMCGGCRAYKFPQDPNGDLVPGPQLGSAPLDGDEAALVMDGKVVYAQIKGGGLSQLLVTPGSSVIELLNSSAADARAVSGITDETMAIAFGNAAEGEQIPRYAPRDFTVAEARQPPDNMLPRSLSLPKNAPPKNYGPGEDQSEAFYAAFQKATALGTIVGLTRKGGVVDGFVLSPAELSIPEVPPEVRPIVKAGPSTGGMKKPSIWLASESPGLAWPVVTTSGDAIWVHGSNFRPQIQSAITVTVDRSIIAATTTADAAGNFSVKLELPHLDEGVHEVAVTERFNGMDKLADATLLLIREAIGKAN